MHRTKRLLWQLYLSSLIITLVSLVALTWYASHFLQNQFLQQTAEDLVSRARLVENQLRPYLAPPDPAAIDAICKKAGPTGSTRITVISPAGQVLGDSYENPAKMDNHLDRPEVSRAFKEPFGVSTRYSRTLEKHMMYVGVPIQANHRTIAVIRTSIPTSGIETALETTEWRMVVVGLVIAIFAALLSLLASRRISRPIEEIKRGAECFARGDFQCALPVSSIEELRGLSEAMKKMASDLGKRLGVVIGQRNELEAVLSSMVEGVVAVDTQEKVIRINDAGAKMFESNPADITGRAIQEVARNPVLQKFISKALTSEKALEKEILLYLDGERTLNAHASVLRDGDGRRIGVVVVLNDITRLKKLENIRKDFVANVSHEIKTPITAIKGFVETLRDGALHHPQDALRFLEIIDKHVNRLESIIEDLLRLSKIEKESETGEILLSPCSLYASLQTTIQICQAQAASKDVTLTLSCEKEIAARINPPLLEQAVLNLLDNAIKYSQPGGTVHLQAVESSDEIVISVTDQGCGIGKEHLPRLFERFYRVDKGRSRKEGGTGLGLAIVKHISQAHGGHVSVSSAPGEGSTFRIFLPRS
jgi:two-component system phosphate regulon sensor histidine kinase PhoR